jgi:SAM-dependent methyltransferase
VRQDTGTQLDAPSVRRQPAAENEGWVRETRLGTWFLTTDIWVTYVLAVALADLERLLGPRAARYPTILDVGCGHGRAFGLLESSFRPELLIGVDIDPAVIARAAQEAARCRCRVELQVGPVRALDVPDASVDLIFCHQTLHHLVDPGSALDEFRRVLKPGGVLLLSESCRAFTRSWPVRLLFRHPPAQRSAEEYLALLRGAGWRFTAAHVSTPDPWWSRPDLGLSAWLGRPARPRPQAPLVNVVAGREPGSLTGRPSA